MLKTCHLCRNRYKYRFRYTIVPQEWT